MTSIYDQHDKAFGNITAAVIAKDGERVATVAFKHGQAVTAFVHWIGTEMVKGQARGGGYDRATAAAANAAQKLAGASLGIGVHETDDHPFRAFYRALCADDGRCWNSALEDAGFTVLYAIS